MVNLDAAIEAAARAIEDTALTTIGRDLGTIHRDAIVRAGIEAAAPLIAAQALRDTATAYDDRTRRNVPDMRPDETTSIAVWIRARADALIAERQPQAVNGM